MDGTVARTVVEAPFTRETRTVLDVPMACAVHRTCCCEPSGQLSPPFGDATFSSGTPTQPSCTTSKSEARSVLNWGWKPASKRAGHCRSKVPLTNMSEPLSATIRPCFFMARKTRRTQGSEKRVSEMSVDALRRSRAPMGSAPEVEPARCEAG